MDRDRLLRGSLVAFGVAFLSLSADGDLAVRLGLAPSQHEYEQRSSASIDARDLPAARLGGIPRPTSA